MVTWIPSLVTSGIVVIVTVGSVIISMRIQLAKLESKFDTKFESVEKDINRLEAKIDGVDSAHLEWRNHCRSRSYLHQRTRY